MAVGPVYGGGGGSWKVVYAASGAGTGCTESVASANGQRPTSDTHRAHCPATAGLAAGALGDVLRLVGRQLAFCRRERGVGGAHCGVQGRGRRDHGSVGGVDGGVSKRGVGGVHGRVGAGVGNERRQGSLGGGAKLRVVGGSGDRGRLVAGGGVVVVVGAGVGEVG